MKHRIYLDHAASTPVHPEVFEAMKPYFSEKFGNPASLYYEGREAKQALDDARGTVAKVLNCLPEEIIFTGSGTESINLAIQGIAKASKSKHIVTTQTEHQAVLETCGVLEKAGWEITYLPVDGYGKVNMDELEKSIKDGTIMVSIIMANNEIGTINDIKTIAKTVKKLNQGTLVHTDACQAAGALPLDVKKLGVDLLTINGSKIYGPKGVGVLYLKKGIKISPIIFGGGQEHRLRSGTQAVPLIAGLAKALKMADKNRDQESSRLIPLRDRLISGILDNIDKTVLNGHPTDRLPNNVNISILEVEGEAMLFYLDEAGIAASSGSACTSGSLEPSHVILATGLPYEAAHGSLRLTLGRSSTQEDVDRVIEVLPGIVEKLREMSPADVNHEQFMKKVDKLRNSELTK